MLPNVSPGTLASFIAARICSLFLASWYHNRTWGCKKCIQRFALLLGTRTLVAKASFVWHSWRIFSCECLVGQTIDIAVLIGFLQFNWKRCEKRSNQNHYRDVLKSGQLTASWNGAILALEHRDLPAPQYFSRMFPLRNIIAAYRSITYTTGCLQTFGKVLHIFRLCQFWKPPNLAHLKGLKIECRTVEPFEILPSRLVIACKRSSSRAAANLKDGIGQCTASMKPLLDWFEKVSLHESIERLLTRPTWMKALVSL